MEIFSTLSVLSLLFLAKYLMMKYEYNVRCTMYDLRGTIYDLNLKLYIVHSSVFGSGYAGLGHSEFNISAIHFLVSNFA